MSINDRDTKNESKIIGSQNREPDWDIWKPVSRRLKNKTALHAHLNKIVLINFYCLNIYRVVLEGHLVETVILK